MSARSGELTVLGGAGTWRGRGPGAEEGARGGRRGGGLQGCLEKRYRMHCRLQGGGGYSHD